MLESFSTKAVSLIDQAKEIAKNSIEVTSCDLVCTSIHLLEAMFLQPDTICHFLFDEQGVKYDEIIEVKNQYSDEFTKETEDNVFTKEFQEIITKSTVISEKFYNEYVYDEHLFLALLDTKCSAIDLITKLGLNIKLLKKDVEEIFNFNETNQLIYQIAKEEPTILKKISLKDSVHPYIERSNYLHRVIYILNKRQKNHPLIIGQAGVGKTSVVEGVSQIISQPIYQLDLGLMVSGTKYRGELEEKLLKAIKKIETENAILFIDEIHNIVGSGSSEGSLDVANILKPYLTSNKIKIIGATTSDEYYKIIKKDQALSRRFQTIFIDEPNEKETFHILKKIKYIYEDHYNIKLKNDFLQQVIKLSNIHLPNKTFPDKAIDVLDETLSRYKIHNTNLYYLLKKTIQDQIGYSIIDESLLQNSNLHFKQMIPFYKRKYITDKTYNNIGIISINEQLYNDLEEDLKFVFNYKSEMKILIDIEDYTSKESINDLIGSSSGYIGFEQGGLLYNHLQLYPLSIVVIKNFDKSSAFLQNFFEKLFTQDHVFNKHLQKITLTNTLFILLNTVEVNPIGFESTKQIKRKSYIDLEIK